MIGDLVPFDFEAGLRAGRGEMFNRTIMILEKVLGRQSADFNRIHEMMRMVEAEISGPPSGAARYSSPDDVELP